MQVEPQPRPVHTKVPKEKRDTSRDRSRDRSLDRSRGLSRTVDSEDLLFNFSEDDEMDRINRKALLGKCFHGYLINFKNLKIRWKVGGTVQMGQKPQKFLAKGNVFMVDTK